VLAAGGAAHLQGAVGHAEPARGVLQAAILLLQRDPRRCVGCGLADFAQSDTERERLRDRALEVGDPPVLFRRGVGRRSSSGKSPTVIGPGPTWRLLTRAINWRKSRTLPGYGRLIRYSRTGRSKSATEMSG